MAISHHLDLYRYWLAKRASRTMPARRDLDPGDIPALLPYLMIVDKVDDQFRYRLVGTATAREIGHDPTGSIVGSYALECAAAARAIYERVFTTARPTFTRAAPRARNRRRKRQRLLRLGPRSAYRALLPALGSQCGTEPCRRRQLPYGPSWLDR